MKEPKKRPFRMLHIGKKAPKGFKEIAGGRHLGKGIWILPVERVENEET